ncbi:transcription factor, partial [Ascosphaera aggregata]
MAAQLLGRRARRAQPSGVKDLLDSSPSSRTGNKRRKVRSYFCFAFTRILPRLELIALSVQQIERSASSSQLHLQHEQHRNGSKLQRAPHQEQQEQQVQQPSPPTVVLNNRHHTGVRDHEHDQSTEVNSPLSHTSAVSAGSESEDDTLQSNQDLIESVIATLDVAPAPVAVMDEYSNLKAQSTRTESVKAYAKIAGRDWTYFVKKLYVSIGRSGNSSAALSPGKGNTPASSQQQEQQQHTPPDSGQQQAIDIDLGPVKFISRLHAEI